MHVRLHFFLAWPSFLPSLQPLPLIRVLSRPRGPSLPRPTPPPRHRPGYLHSYSAHFRLFPHRAANISNYAGIGIKFDVFHKSEQESEKIDTFLPEIQNTYIYL
jgi:hypothetical protein